jgi:hypothetical protein
VIVDDGGGVRSGEIESIGIAIGVALAGTGKRGFKQVEISQARRTAVLVELASVYGKNLWEIDP